MEVRNGFKLTLGGGAVNADSNHFRKLICLTPPSVFPALENPDFRVGPPVDAGRKAYLRTCKRRGSRSCLAVEFIQLSGDQITKVDPYAYQANLKKSVSGNGQMTA
jgi:hypothetical protein